MQRIRLITMAATAVLTLGAVLSATAWAAELPEFSVETGFTGTGSKSSIETKGGSKITCEKLTTEGAATSKKAGTIHIELKECKALGGLVKCTGLAEASGIILMLGEWHLVSDGAERVFLLISINSNHLACATSLMILEGTLLASISPLGVKTTKEELVLKESKGKAEFNEYPNDEGKAIKTQLLASTNEGTFEEAGAESTEYKLTDVLETEIVPPLGVAVVPLELLFEKILNQEKLITVVNFGLMNLKVIAQTLEGAEPGGWQNDVKCVGKVLKHGESCAINVKLITVTSKSATDKIEIEYANTRKIFANVALLNP